MTKHHSSSGTHTLTFIAIPVTQNPRKSTMTKTGGVLIVIARTMFTRDNSVIRVIGATTEKVLAPSIFDRQGTIE